MKLSTQVLALIITVSAVPVAAQQPAATSQTGKTEKGIILRQFRMAEEFLKSKTNSDEERRRTLNANLIRGMRQTINRMFYEQQEELLKDLKPETIAYENPTSPLVYYVKYKNLIVRFDFATNPEVNIQAPMLKKILVLDEETQKYIDKRIAEEPAGAAPAP